LEDETRHCHINLPANTAILVADSSCGCGCTFPNIERFGADLFEKGSIDEEALGIEGVLDGGLDIQKSLG
jgi:hypothetical protein